jgi:hypothetical protein
LKSWCWRMSCGQGACGQPVKKLIVVPGRIVNVVV